MHKIWNNIYYYLLNNIYLFICLFVCLCMPLCFLCFYACFWGEITPRYVLDEISKDKLYLKTRGMTMNV